jgi:antitoxin HigA-1
MAIKNPKPMHPGRVLVEVFMQDHNLNQTEVAELLDCSHRKINEIIHGKRGISAAFALDLEKAFKMPAEMWVRMQAEYDLWVERQKRVA